MAHYTFTQQEIERLNDRISNVLENSRCRDVFQRFLRSQHNPALMNALNLWLKSNESSFNEEECFDLIEEIDDFNANPFYSINEELQKIAYIKQECARILEKIRPQFIMFLHKYHQRLC